MIVSFFSVGCLTTGGIVWTTVLQRSVPARMIGRVSSLDWVLSLGLAPLSYALTGPIADAFGARSTLLWCGVVGGVVLRLVLPRRARRSRRLGERGRDEHHGRRGLSSGTKAWQSRASRLSSVAACSRARSRTRSSASSRGASTSRCTSTTASPASRSSGSSTARCRRRSTGSGAASPRRSWSFRTVASPSTSRPRSCARRARRSTCRSRSRFSRRRGSFPPERLEEHAAVGELGLDGRLRRVGGVLAVAEAATRAAIDRLICPVDSAAEAALAGVEPVPARHLAEAVAYLRGETKLEWVGSKRTRAGGAPARSGRRARPRARTARARDRRRRQAQPSARRAAGHRQDDARAPAAGSPPAARAVRGARGDADPLRRRARLRRAPADHHAAVSRAASQRVDSGDRRRRLGPATG